MGRLRCQQGRQLHSGQQEGRWLRQCGLRQGRLLWPPGWAPGWGLGWVPRPAQPHPPLQRETCRLSGRVAMFGRDAWGNQLSAQAPDNDERLSRRQLTCAPTAGGITKPLVLYEGSVALEIEFLLFTSILVVWRNVRAGLACGTLTTGTSQSAGQVARTWSACCLLGAAY